MSANAPPDASGVIRDAYGPVVRLSEQDGRGLCWLKTRARQLLNGLKRRRRYGIPRGAGYTPEEGQLIDSLVTLEREAGRLLTLVEAPARKAV